MKANELRVGNFVKDRGGKILRIYWFEQDKVCMEMRLHDKPVHPLTEYFGYLQPIPLTPEILEKAGFVAFEDGWYGLIPFGLGYVYTWNIYDITIRWKGSCIEVKYLHDLQNLHFSLYKEELNIEL